MKVVFSNIGFKAELLFLPIIWGKVRQYCEYVDDRDFSFVEWLDPIFEGNVNESQADQILEKYNWEEVDIFFPSHYVWNWRVNLYMIDEIRKINPNIIVVGGGPSALYRPHQETHLFHNHDYVSAGEAEEVLADVIWNVKNNLPLSDIVDLIDPRNPREHKPKRLNLSQHKSPYVTYGEDYIRFTNYILDKNKVEKYKRRFLSIGDRYSVGMLFETNRGCPYKCSFCDWGLTTNSKVKRYDVETIKEEIVFVCNNLKPTFVFWGDANAGIFDVDIEYAKTFGEEKQKTGYPLSLYYAPAKNNKENTNKLVETFYEYGLLSINQISFQHFDEEVLDAIDRSDIPLSKLKDAMDSSFQKGIPIEAAIICGNPGDTLEKWKTAINEALECSFADLRIHDFMILPNAPAAHPDYMKKHGIGINKSFHFEYESGVYSDETSRFEAWYTRSCNTFTEYDYAEMQLYNSLIFALNSFALTSYIEKWCYHNSEISYVEFYDLLRQKPWFKNMTETLLKHIEEWVFEKRKYKFAPFQDVEVSFDFYIYMSCLFEHEIFYNEVKEVLLENYTDDENFVNELIKFQKRVVKCHWPEVPTTLEYDLQSYFKNIVRMSPKIRKPDFEVEKKTITIETNSGLGLKDFNDLKKELVAQASGKSINMTYREILF